MTFTASNGSTVERDHNGDVLMDRGQEHMSLFMRDGTALALREFFAQERDEELGRWRWPENPDYVVYPVGSGTVVTATKESNGNSGQFTRELLSGFGELLNTLDAGYSRAARAYFEAHPEPKPWDDAKPGEIWVVTVGEGPEFVARVEIDGPPFARFIDLSDGMSCGPKAGIVAARRIWPEPD